MDGRMGECMDGCMDGYVKSCLGLPRCTNRFRDTCFMCGFSKPTVVQGTNLLTLKPTGIPRTNPRTYSLPVLQLSCCEVDVNSLRVASDFDAVAKSRDRSMSPAGATVLAKGHKMQAGTRLVHSRSCGIC